MLEITEAQTLSQLDIVDKVLAELRELGCALALDDFGTGFSSLSVLPRVPMIQEIKIDRSFVSEMEHTPKAAAVVRSTVELARGLDLLVVAEGVERESQRRMLWELGCTAGQGHLFAKPMPLAKIMRLGADPGRAAARPRLGRANAHAAPPRPHVQAWPGVRLEPVIALVVDFALYALSALFAEVTAHTSTLAPHRSWGAIAFWGYAGAAFSSFSCPGTGSS